MGMALDEPEQNDEQFEKDGIHLFYVGAFSAFIDPGTIEPYIICIGCFKNFHNSFSDRDICAVLSDCLAVECSHKVWN